MANYTFLAAQNYRTNRKKEDSKGSSSSDYRKDEENARLARIEAIQRLRNGTTYNPTLLHTAEKMASDDTKEKFSNTKTTLDSVTTAKSAASTHSKKSPAITAGTTSSLMESAKSKSQPSAGASLSAITTAKSSAKKNMISRNDFSSVTPDDTLLEKANEPVTEEQATRRKAYSIYNGLDEETYKKANEAFKAADISGPSAAARQRTAVANALMESGISKEKAAQYAKNWRNVQEAKGIIDDARYESSVEKRVNELSDDQYKELGNYIVRTDPKYYFDHPDLLDDSKSYYGQWESVDEYKQKFMDTYGVSEDEFDIYVDAAKRKLNQEATERDIQKRQENMDKYPWATAAYNVEDLATGFIADGMAAVTTAIDKLTGRQIDPYSYGFRQQRLNAAVEQKSAEQFADLVGKLGGGETAQNIAAGAYSVGNSIIKSKMAMDMGTGVADSLGLVKGTSQYRNIASLTNSGLFSASAFSNSVRESKDAGLSDEQALRTGVANGINESLMEYLSFDKVLGLLDKPGKVTIKEGVKRFMGAMFAEGSEELSTDLANTIADHLMNGEFEDTKNQVSYLVANGMDEETAKEQVWSDTLKQWTEDFIAGAISGGVFAGGRIASSNINYHNLADNVSVELKEQLAETSKTMEEGTTAREIAESKPVEEWTRDDTAKVLQSMEEIAGEKGNYEDILAHEIEKTGKGSEEAKTIAQDMVKAASTSSEDTTEEDSARRIETWDEGTQETYGKFLRGELTRENDTVASAYEVRESQRQEKQRGNSKTTVARAYEKSSNNPVIAVKISDITKSDAKVMLSDGSTTKLSEIRFDNRQTQQLYNLASTFESSNAANAFIEEFPGGDVATYARSVMAYYNAGRNGAKSFESLMSDSKNGVYAGIDSSINRTFYELGVNDRTPVKSVPVAQAKTVSRGKVLDQRTEVTPDSDFVTRVASVLSNADYENTVIKNEKLDNNARGEFNRILAEVVITTDSENPLAAVVHEHIGEVSRAYNAEGWDKVVDEVMDYMYSKEGMQWVNNRVSTYKEAYKKVSSETNNRDAATEFVNDVIGEIFTTKEGLEHLMNHAQKNLNQKEQKSFIQSIKDFFNNMIQSLKDYMESHSRRFNRSEYLKASAQLEKIRDDALAAWDKAIENRKGEMAGEFKNDSTVDEAEKKFALELEESAQNITPLLNTDYETIRKTNVSIVEINPKLDSKYVIEGRVSINKIIEDQLKLCERVRPGKIDLYYIVFDKVNGLKAQISGRSIKHSINITDGTLLSEITEKTMNDIICYTNVVSILKESVYVADIKSNKKHGEKGKVLYGVIKFKNDGLYLVRTILEHREGAGYEIAKIGIVENIRAIKTQQIGDMHWKNNSAALLQSADAINISSILDYVKNNIKARDSIQIQLVEQWDKIKNGPHIRQATNNSAYDNSGIHKENISSNKENVNKRYSLNVDTEGNELSDQQQEYFKDSKVRDENGKLKPVYHGTGSHFNVFSYDFIGKTGSAEGYGFYFTDQIEKARGYSKKGTDVMSGYLNITKPLSTSELTLTENEIRGLLSELDPTGDEILANFEYTGEGYPSKQWYNKAMKETIDTLMENESDDDVLAEIVNSGSDNETVLTTVRNLYGYDGYIVEDKYEDGNVYVAFSSEQFKNADNRQPTSDKDIRFSIEIANDEYKESEDSELYDIAKRIYDSGATSKKAYYKLSETLPERLVNDIKEILNIDVSDYGNEISETSIAHINRRHGPNGISDHSMEDVHNVARIEYAIENYAEIEEGARSKEYRNRDGSYSKTIVMRANIGSDFYYVVEAVPDAKIKTLHVVSAYINKNDTFSDVVVSNDPNRYVQDEHRPNVSFPKSNVSSDKGNVNKRYSLNVDSEGNELSDRQQEYFKNSKVRDENGNLMVMYHGTPYGDFTVFKNELNYFTPNKKYGDRYQNPSASSVRGYYKDATNPKTYAVYLNIQNPFDISNEETMDIFVNEYVKGGYAAGINPYISEREIREQVKNGIDWTEADNLKEFIEDMEYDYDGLVLDEGADGGYGDDVHTRGKSYVTFNPNQVKNIDNRKPTGDKDIRYSLNLENEGKKYSTNIDEALFEALEETWTLEEQKQASGIVQQGFEALQSVEINDKIVNKIAKNILKQYSSDYSTEDLSYNIKNIFAYLKNTENVSFDDMTKVMQEVAKPVLEQSKRIDPRDKADYDDFINYLSQKRIKLTSAQRQEVEYTYGSYDDFRKSMFGKVTLSNKGVPLDDIWSEIVQQSGYRLSEDVSDADEITALVEVIEDMKPVPRNPFGMDMDDAAYDVALDIYRQFFIEQAAEKANEKVKKVIGQKTDQLIEKQQQYRRKYGQMYMEAVAKERRKTEELQKASIARLQGEFYKLDQAERDAIRESDLISQAVIKAEREKYEGRLRRLRNQKNDKIAEINARHANSRTKAAQQRRAAYLKEGIRKNMDSLNSMLMHPNENKHIPAGMVRSVIDVCEAVNVDTGKSRLMKEKLEKLQGFYESYRNDDQFSFDYDERIDKDIDTLKNMFAGRNYTELTNDELQRVYNIVNALKQQISNANKLIDNKLVKDAHEGAKQAVEEVTRAKRHANNVVTYNLDKFASYHLNAYREFRKLSGYKDNSVLMSIYDELERGQQKELEIQRHVNDAFLGLLQSNRKEAMRLESYKPDDLVDIGLKDENGKPVMVTRAMRLSVIMHSYNKGNMNHVLNEGLTIPDIKLYEKGKIKEAWEKAKTYRYVSYELMLDAIKSKDSERLTAEQAKYERSVRKLESDLSDFEKEFLKIAKEVFHNYFGKEINKVTMQTRGYAAARVENYYPIKTDPDFTHSNFGGLVMDSSLEGMGMLKERVRSKNPILLEDITKVVIRQANNTSKYVGYAIPIRNFNMLMNSTFHDSNGRIRNMKETVRNVWGNSNEKYLENIFKDIQGARKTESGIMDNLRSSFAGATLTLNVSVAMKQAASYPTAAAVVGYGPLLKAMKDIPKGFNLKKGIPELEKRNSLLWVRSQGYSNERIADTTQTSAMKSKAKEKLDWISFMDIGTVRTLEYASMYYVDSNFKNLKKGSDEYWDKVSETFTKVVAETQPNYTTLQQAAVTRDPNKFMKQIIMFKTQSLQNFGIVYDAVGNYNAKSIALKEAKKTNSAELIATAKKEKMQAAKNLANATTSQIVAAAVFNAMTILSKLMHHKWKPFQDDDGEWSSEKLMNFFMVGMVDTLSGSIIWGSEIADVLEALLLGETYYGTEVSVIEMWNDCNNAIINLHNNINKMNGAQTDEEYDKYNYKVQTSILTLVTTLGQFKSVPVNNVYNMFNAVYTYAAGTSIMNGDVEKQYDRIVDAYLDGDTKEYKRLYEQKANTLSNPDSAKSGTKSTIKERYLNGEMSQEQAESFLNDLGYDDAYFTIKEWDYTNETGEKYLKYGELDSAIEDAVKSGDRQSVIDAVKDLTDHGIKESSVESHISKTFKPIYQESHSKANLKSYLITAYEYCGVPRDKAMEKIKAWEEE